MVLFLYHFTIYISIFIFSFSPSICQCFYSFTYYPFTTEATHCNITYPYSKLSAFCLSSRANEQNDARRDAGS